MHTSIGPSSFSWYEKIILLQIFNQYILSYKKFSKGILYFPCTLKIFNKMTLKFMRWVQPKRSHSKINLISGSERLWMSQHMKFGNEWGSKLSISGTIIIMRDAARTSGTTNRLEWRSEIGNLSGFLKLVLRKKMWTHDQIYPRLWWFWEMIHLIHINKPTYSISLICYYHPPTKLR